MTLEVWLKVDYQKLLFLAQLHEANSLIIMIMYYISNIEKISVIV